VEANISERGQSSPCHYKVRSRRISRHSINVLVRRTGFAVRLTTFACFPSDCGSNLAKEEDQNIVN